MSSLSSRKTLVIISQTVSKVLIKLFVSVRYYSTGCLDPMHRTLPEQHTCKQCSNAELQSVS